MAAATTASVAGAHIRIARPTNNLAAVRRFYCDGLGLGVLFEFGGHAGFDGLMLGHEAHGYHLEFTSKQDHDAGRAPSLDNLLIFYLPDSDAWARAVDRMMAAGYPAVEPFNPYWADKGRTFEDPDGYRVVLQNTGWVNKDPLAANAQGAKA